MSSNNVLNLSPNSCCRRCLLLLSARPSITRQTLPQSSFRALSQNALKFRRKNENTKATSKKKKVRQHYKQHDKKDLIQFSLLDAMRFIRAFEVGQSPVSAKYDLAVKLDTKKNGPTVRNQLRLPHPLRTELRICVICPPTSRIAEQARAAGATLVGEDNVFEAVKEKRIEFDRCICHQDSLNALSKSGIGRVLGPRKLMPSAKMGTVVRDVSTALKDMVGASMYRERQGTVRMAIGQLGFGPEEMQRNIQTFMQKLKRDATRISESSRKNVYEVVLSSTHSPGFSLNGNFRSPDSISVEELSTEP